MKYYVIIVVILLCVTLSNAQTEVSGTIVNEIWILENSPYLVVGDIQVARLTIQPGVSVIFEGDYHFDIDGAITAIGEQHAQISFAADTDVESWKGILFQNSAPGSELRWCRIENANSSGIRIIDSSPVLQYCTVRLNTSYDSGGGLKIVNSQPNELLISDCTFSENQTYSNHLMARSHGSGIWVLSLDGVIRFENCRIENNLTETADGSVYGGGGYVEGNVEFSLCTIKDNTVFAHENIPGGSSHGHGGGLY
ncbi:right-handed parallel beta-helix repeat-containing protein, partial [bacterium]|nr:right-handed parallel beta-helix repeat-containing protein [bacterium]